MVGMIWKKIAVICGAIVSVPLAFVVGGVCTHPFYMRFVFNGELSDFAPGDAIGELLYLILFSTSFLLAELAGWVIVYRRVSN